MSHRGFTLIETLVAFAILGILLLLAIPEFSGLQDRLRLQTAVREVAADLRIVRQAAMAKQCEYQVLFDGLSQRYRLPWAEKVFPSDIRFGFGAGVEGPPSDPHPLTDPDGITFANNRAIFYPTGGNSVGTLYLTAGDGETLAITLAITGRVRLWKWTQGGWK